jgi:hypothetical protein
MKNSDASNSQYLSADIPALDSKLGGGLRRGSITELVGSAQLTCPLMARFIKSSLAARRKVGLVDCVHDLGVFRIPFRKLSIVQPTRVRELPIHLNRFSREGFGLVVLNLGSEVWFENGIPKSAVDEDLGFTLAQVQAVVRASSLACLSVADWPVMPGGPTVIRALGRNPETSLADCTVVPAIESGAQRLG